MARTAIPAPRALTIATGAMINKPINNTGMGSTTCPVVRAPVIPPKTMSETVSIKESFVGTSTGGGAFNDQLRVTDSLSMTFTQGPGTRFANILSPSQSGAKLPVAIIIHGGGLYGGGINDGSGTADMAADLALEGYVTWNIDYLLAGVGTTSSVTATSSGTTLTDTVTPPPPGAATGWIVWSNVTGDHQLIVSQPSTSTFVTQNPMALTSGNPYQLIGGGIIHVQAVMKSVWDAVAFVLANTAAVGGDPSNVSVFGGSSGGHIAVMGWLTGFGGNLTTPRAVVSLSGPMYMYDRNNVVVLAGGHVYAKNAMATYLPSDDYPTWDYYSPAYLMDSVDVAGLGPLWLGAGAGEPESGASVENSRRFRDKLIARGVTPAYYEWADGTHQWPGLAVSNTLLGQLLPWLRATQGGSFRRMPAPTRVAAPARAAVP